MKNFNYRSALQILFAVVALSSCSKKNDVTGGGKSTDTSTVKPLVYNYSLLSDSLQLSTYNTYISADRNYYIQNSAGTTTFNYWPQAHVLNIFEDAYLRTSNNLYVLRMKALLNGIKTENGGVYPNEFYDDMGWLANASIRAYNITSDTSYLNVAKLLYVQIQGASNNTAGGGIAWQRTQLYYKNTPSTGNAIILACGIYQISANSSDLTFAKTLYTWLKTTLVTSSGVVYDGINRNQNDQIDAEEYTYNQGLFIGAAVSLYNITKDPTYLQDAILTANNEIADPNLVTNGIFKNEGQGDGGLFKSIAVRYMVQLVELPDLDAADRANYSAFLQRNAQSLYIKGIARPSLLASPDWTQIISGSTDLTTQLSGVTMIEAAAKLKTEGKIQ
jgi:predicted alpha-1,6-mannanase (GH76 family)